MPSIKIGIIQITVVDKNAFVTDPEHAESGTVRILKRGDFAVIKLKPQIFKFSGIGWKIGIFAGDRRLEFELIRRITDGGVEDQLVDPAIVGRIEVFHLRNLVSMTAQHDRIAFFQQIEQAHDIVTQNTADSVFTGRKQRNVRNEKGVTAVGKFLQGFFKEIHIRIHQIVEEEKVFADSKVVVGVFAFQIFSDAVQIGVDHSIPRRLGIGTADIVVAADHKGSIETVGKLFDGSAQILFIQLQIVAVPVDKIAQLDGKAGIFLAGLDRKSVV